MKHQWLVFLLVMLAAVGCGNITRECPSGLTACDNTCSDMQRDNLSCGACGNVCGAMETCVNGSCQCSTGGKVCGDTCVDTATDAANCGDCGVACDTGEVCEGGTCGCPTGQMECDGACVDTLTDASHCGSCTNACDTGTNCVGGACGCPSGQMDCSGTCADTQTDSSHCGNCTTACSGGQTCQSGDCACTGANIIECNSVCVNKLTDNSHCGDCSTMCMNGKTCQTGSCQCTGGLTACSDGSCYDVATDRNHCGSSCLACNANQLCNSGCSAAPALSIATKWESPTGWTVSGGGALTMTFSVTTTAPGITYECRTYLKSASAPAFTKCDGVNGTTTTYHPPTTGGSGTYRTEVRYLQNGVAIGSPVIYEYYAHTKLNGVAKCPLPFTDAQYFQTAINFNTANPTAFPIPGTAFTSDAALKLANPFIVVPFKQVQQSNSMAGEWGTFPRDQIVRDLSLRHSWVLGNNNRLLLMKRNFRSPSNSCKNISPMHHVFNASFDFALCDVFVMNLSGVGLCIGKNTAGTAPEVKGTPYVAGWWRMRTVRYASFYDGAQRSSAYCGVAACMSNPALTYLPP